MTVLAHPGLRSRLARVLLALPLYALLLWLGAVSLTWNLLAMVLYPLLPSARGRNVGRAGIAYAYRCFWGAACACGMMRVDARCLDVLRDEPNLIVAANHPTMLDALLLVAHLPRSACIMKASLMGNVFLGAGARLARYICNDSAWTMIRLSVADLKAGGQLVIFPEGTRTTMPPLNAFRPGLTLISKLARAPIQTVFIDTDTRYLSKGWPIWRVPALPLVFTLRLGERFPPPQDSGDALAELEHYFRHSMQQSPPGTLSECKTPRAHTSS